MYYTTGNYTRRIHMKTLSILSVKKKRTSFMTDNEIHNLEIRLMGDRGSAHMHDTRFPFIVPIVAFLFRVSRGRGSRAIINYSR